MTVFGGGGGGELMSELEKYRPTLHIPFSLFVL